MLNAATLNKVKSTEQFKSLEKAGLRLVSTPRQLANGTLSFEGVVKSGERTINASYDVTAFGSVYGNKFNARIVDGASPMVIYRRGLAAINELLMKRLKSA